MEHTLAAGPSFTGAVLTACEAWSARLSYLAHQVAAEHFVVGLPLERAREDNIAVRTWPDEAWVPYGPGEVEIAVEGTRVVATDPDGRSRAAVYLNPTQGVVQLARGLAFEPRQVAPRPLGGLEVAPELELGWVLDEDDACWAVLALEGGRVIGEAYRPPFDERSRNVCWSMGKSLVAGLVGVLVQRGVLELDEPTGFPEWADDGRSAITVRHLLTMTGGLDCAQAFPETGWLHTHVYEGVGDVAAFALSRPPVWPPGSYWSYNNADILAAVELVRRRAGGDWLAFAQRELFDRIGMDGVTLCTDERGLPILCGYDYLTARDWARYGLLYLRRGDWLGDRVLPEWWTDFVSTPVVTPEPPPGLPRHSEPGPYGATFWVEPERGSFSARGWGGNRMWIVPERDLVVVRLRRATSEPEQEDTAVLDAVLER